MSRPLPLALEAADMLVSRAGPSSLMTGLDGAQKASSTWEGRPFPSQGTLSKDMR